MTVTKLGPHLLQRLKENFSKTSKRKTTQVTAKIFTIMSPAVAASKYTQDKGCRTALPRHSHQKTHTGRHFPYPVFTFLDRNGSSCSESRKERPGLELFDMLVRSPKRPFAFGLRNWVTP